MGNHTAFFILLCYNLERNPNRNEEKTDEENNDAQNEFDFSNNERLKFQQELYEEACKQIKILSEKILSPLELGILKERSIVRREEGIALTENILKQYRREGKYFDEIIGG